MSPVSHAQRFRAAVVAMASAAALAACGGPPAPDAGADTGADVAAGARTEVNCGIEVSVPRPPERIYALYQPAIETLHALGVGDRLVGTAFLDAPVLPQFADAQAGLPYVPDLPQREALLAANPDLVLAGFNNAFTATGDESISTRADLGALGVRTWINAPLCPSADGLSDEAIDPANVSMETIYDDLGSLGRILGVPERADALVADLKSRVAAVERRVAGKPAPRVAILMGDDDGSYRVASGIDFGSRVLEMAGARNAFGDLAGKRHVAVSTEELIARDPDIILTSTCCDQATVEKEGRADVQRILADPALAGSTAVRNRAVHGFLFADRAASLRAPYAAERVADLVHPR